MSCAVGQETDFAAFALERSAPEWARLRDHYPRCRDCAREVARWSRLVRALREEGARVSEHPSPERLHAYRSGPLRLDASEREVIGAHLAGCAPCRSELRVLARFDFSALARVGAARPARGAWLGALTSRVSRRPLAPALAAAVLLAVAIPAALLGRWLSTRWSVAVAERPVAHEEAPAAPGRALVAVVPERELAPSEIASEEPAPHPVPAPSPPTAPAQPTPASIARAAPRREPPAEAPAAPAPLRIAALLPAEPPHYRPDAALVGGSLEPARVASLLRGGARPLPALEVLAPEHVGATSEPAPVLYWHLSAASAVPIEIALYSERDEATPLLDLWLEAPVAAGLHAFRFAEHGLRLTPDTTVHWSAALVPNRGRRELDSVAQTALRYAPMVEALRARVESEAPARRAHALADAGYWLDAFALFQDWIAAEPDAANLRAQRAALLEQVGLGSLASGLGTPPRS